MKAVQSDIIDYKCTHSDEFFYTTPLTQCSSYYRCYQNQKLKYDCAHGTVYDFYKQKCTTSGVCYEPVCQGKTDGVYADTTQACRRYFRCSVQLRLGMDRAAQGDDIARECAGLFEQAFMQHIGLRSGRRFFGQQHCASRPRSQASR